MAIADSLNVASIPTILSADMEFPRADPIPPTSPQQAWRSHLPVLLAGSWIAVDLLLLAASFVPLQSEPSDWWLAIVLGMVFAQLSFGSFWLMLGPGPATVRIPLVAAGSMLAMGAFFRQVVARDELEMRFIVFFVLLLMLFQFSLLSLSALFQRLLRWQAVWQGEVRRRITHQFGVRDLLIWMFGVGALLSIYRLAFSRITLSNTTNPELLTDLFVALVILSSTLAQAFLAAGIALSATHWRRHATGGWLSLMLAATGALPLSSGVMNFAIVVLILVVQYALLWSMLAWLRQQGLRLVDDFTSRNTEL